MTSRFIGVDIGGTKCAVCLGEEEGMEMRLVEKVRFSTPETPERTLERISEAVEHCSQGQQPAAIGISCGGPLDSRRGLILAPPHLPGWEHVDVRTPLEQRFGIPVGLQNDANAGALAEWFWGAGRGCHNLVFLTCGTGMGAGLILDDRLYSGTNELAGEVGHMRLAISGPISYGKAGSFEGFCSGEGIAHLARDIALQRLDAGEPVGYCPSYDDLAAITAETVGNAAQAGDSVALAVWERVAHRLGQGLALLVDILNPERIILGSIYVRQQAFLEPLALKTLRIEALTSALAVCQVVPAGLGEQVGDFASLAVAQACFP